MAIDMSGFQAITSRIKDFNPADNPPMLHITCKAQCSVSLSGITELKKYVEAYQSDNGQTVLLRMVDNKTEISRSVTVTSKRRGNCMFGNKALVELLKQTKRIHFKLKPEGDGCYTLDLTDTGSTAKNVGMD